MLGIRHKYVNLYLSWLLNLHHIFHDRDVSIFIVIKYTEIILRHFICSIFQYIFQKSAPDDEQKFLSYNCLELPLQKA